MQAGYRAGSCTGEQNLRLVETAGDELVSELQGALSQGSWQWAFCRRQRAFAATQPSCPPGYETVSGNTELMRVRDGAARLRDSTTCLSGSYGFLPEDRELHGHRAPRSMATEFHAQALAKVSTLLERLRGSQLERTQQQIQSLRSAFDAALKPLEAAVAAKEPPQKNDLVLKLVEDLSQSAAAQAQSMADRVSHEAEAKIEKLRAKLAEETEQLQTARSHHKAADTARAQAEADRRKAEAQFNEQIERLRADLAAEAERAQAARSDHKAADAARAQAEADHRKAEARSNEQIERLRADLAAEAQRAQAARSDHKAADTARAQGEADHRKAEARSNEQIERLRADLAAEAQRAQAARSDQAAADAALAQALADHRQAETLFNEQTERLRTELAGETERAHRARADQMLAEAASAQAGATQRETEGKLQGEIQARSAAEQQLEQVRHLLDAALSEVTASRKQLEREATEREKLANALNAIPPQPFDALLTACQKLNRATSIDEVLVTLVEALANDFSRVALFRLGSNHLKGVHEIGFNFENDISKVVMPLTMDSLLSHAVSSGRVQGFVPSELPPGSRAPFGGSPTYLLTLPVSVRGKTAAVIYADDAGRAEPTSPERSVKFVQLLLWYALPLLARLSTDLTTLTELRQYAAMLVNEIGHIYTADAAGGKKSDELQARLLDNLQCARQIFSQRVAPEGPFAATLLEEQLVLQAQAATPFGRDVAAVLGRQRQAPVWEAAS